MKRIFICWIILLFVQVACSPETEVDGDGVIKPANLSDYEKNLTDLIGAQSFVFDIDITNKDTREINTVVDYYENGELVDTLGGMGMGINEEDMEESIRAVFIHQKPDNKEEIWISSIMMGDGHGSQSTPHDVSGREEILSTASGGISMPASLSIGEKKVIATVVNSNKNGISIYNEINTEKDLIKATDYEQVYIISIELR